MNKDKYIKQLESQVNDLDEQIRILNKDNLDTIEIQERESCVANCFREEVRAVLRLIEMDNAENSDIFIWQAQALMNNYKQRKSKHMSGEYAITEQEFQEFIKTMKQIIGKYSFEK